MHNKVNDENKNLLYKALLSLETEEECEKFLEDLCTGPELKSIAQRLQVARLLRQEMVYSQIVELTGASTATISRVNRSLQYGADGYEIVFERLNNQ